MFPGLGSAAKLIPACVRAPALPRCPFPGVLPAPGVPGTPTPLGLGSMWGALWPACAGWLPEWCRLIPKQCWGVDVAMGMWGLAGHWQSPSERAEVMDCGVILQLRRQGHAGGQSAPWLLGLLCRQGQCWQSCAEGWDASTATLPEHPAAGPSLCGRILPPWGRLQQFCSPARALCTVVWLDPSRACCQSNSWYFPHASVSPSVRSSPGLLNTGWLTLELDNFFKKNPCLGNMRRALSA